MNAYVSALVGGLLIGLSASLLLLFKGRIFGISGILGGIIKPRWSDMGWRVVALLGLFTGGSITYIYFPEAFPSQSYDPIKMALAGLLVGFGTQLGGGCTSGHGVCGISRVSRRSILATITFIITGVITVAVMSAMGA